MIVSQDRSAEIHRQYLTIGLFLLVSLRGFYYESLGFAPPSLLGLLIIIVLAFFLLVNGIRPSRQSILVVAFYVAIFFTSIVSALLFDGAFDTKRFLGFLLIILMAISIGVVFKKIDYERLILFYIAFHSSFFWAQFFAGYFFSADLDFLSLAGAMSQRNMGGAFMHDSLGVLRRYGGLFPEPGTYATFVAPMVALFVPYAHDSRYNSMLFFCALMSLIFTFSVFGFVFFSVILVSYFLHYKIKFLLILPLTALLLFYYIFPYLYFRFFFRTEAYGLSTGLEFRQDILTQVSLFVMSDLKSFFFGAGLLSPGTDARLGDALLLNDATLALSLVYSIGPFFSLTFFVLLSFYFVRRSNKSAFFAVLIIMMSKTSLFWEVTPLFFLMVLLQNQYCSSSNSLSVNQRRSIRY